MKHSMVAFVGESGAGKTTLSRIISGLIQPTAGEILIDGASQELRRLVGYVPQENYLFNGTIRDNLSLQTSTTSEANIWSALEKASALDFVWALPKKLETIVGERGIKLSGGERQRLAIARALIIEPEILVLDEATSFLDYKNENHIQNSISKLHGKITMIVIAHRFSTIRQADTIYVLEKGKIKDSGCWNSAKFREEHLLERSFVAGGHRHYGSESATVGKYSKHSRVETFV